MKGHLLLIYSTFMLFSYSQAGISCDAEEFLTLDSVWPEGL